MNRPRLGNSVLLASMVLIYSSPAMARGSAPNTDDGSDPYGEKAAKVAPAGDSAAAAASSAAGVTSDPFPSGSAPSDEPATPKADNKWADQAAAAAADGLPQQVEQASLPEAQTQRAPRAEVADIPGGAPKSGHAKAKSHAERLAKAPATKGEGRADRADARLARVEAADTAASAGDADGALGAATSSAGMTTPTTMEREALAATSDAATSAGMTLDGNGAAANDAATSAGMAQNDRNGATSAGGAQNDRNGATSAGGAQNGSVADNNGEAGAGGPSIFPNRRMGTDANVFPARMGGTRLASNAGPGLTAFDGAGSSLPSAATTAPVTHAPSPDNIKYAIGMAALAVAFGVIGIVRSPKQRKRRF